MLLLGDLTQALQGTLGIGAAQHGDEFRTFGNTVDTVARPLHQRREGLVELLQIAPEQTLALAFGQGGQFLHFQNHQVVVGAGNGLAGDGGDRLQDGIALEVQVALALVEQAHVTRASARKPVR